VSGTRRKGKSPPPTEVTLASRLGSTVPPKPSSGHVLPGDASPASRRDAREQRRRRTRNRWLALAVVLVLVLVAGLVAVWWLGRDAEPTAAAPVAERTERTVTMTLARPDEGATSGVLLIADPDPASANAVLVPSRVFIEGPTPDGIPFGETVLLGELAAPGDALADTLDVIVDGTWQLTSPELAALVDVVGGVLVDVDTDILSSPGQGRQTIVLSAGDQQLLTGSQAVAFAQYLAPDEPQEARLARFGQVVDQLTRRLPDSQEEIVDVLAQADADRQVTGTPEQLAAMLLAFGDVARDGDAGFQSLPTTPLETGGPQPAFIVDPEGAEQLRQTVLSGSIPSGASGTDIQVLVQNGVGTPGLEQEAADLLRTDGYAFINGGNANSFENKQTDILIPDTTPASLELGANVAATLGVPDSAVQTTSQGSATADVIVILGADFKP